MNNNAREVFAANLKHYLNINGKTQADLVRDLGYKQPTVSDWAKAKKYPRVDKMQEIADYFGIPMSSLTSEKPATAEGDGLDAEILERINRLDESRKQDAIKYLDFLISQGNE